MLIGNDAVVAFVGTITEDGIVKVLEGPDNCELLPEKPLPTVTDAPP